MCATKEYTHISPYSIKGFCTKNENKVKNSEL